jgi:hypothetical protein
MVFFLHMAHGDSTVFYSASMDTAAHESRNTHHIKALVKVMMGDHFYS